MGRRGDGLRGREKKRRKRRGKLKCNDAERIQRQTEKEKKKLNGVEGIYEPKTREPIETRKESEGVLNTFFRDSGETVMVEKRKNERKQRIENKIRWKRRKTVQ